MRYLWLIFLLVLCPQVLRCESTSLSFLIDAGLYKDTPELDKYYPELHHMIMVDYYTKGYFLDDLTVMEIKRISKTTKVIVIRNHEIYSMYFVEKIQQGVYKPSYCHWDIARLIIPELEEETYMESVEACSEASL